MGQAPGMAITDTAASTRRVSPGDHRRAHGSREASVTDVSLRRARLATVRRDLHAARYYATRTELTLLGANAAELAALVGPRAEIVEPARDRA
jgi:hypothetical protein